MFRTSKSIRGFKKYSWFSKKCYEIEKINCESKMVMKLKKQLWIKNWYEFLKIFPDTINIHTFLNIHQNKNMFFNYKNCSTNFRKMRLYWKIFTDLKNGSWDKKSVHNFKKCLQIYKNVCHFQKKRNLVKNVHKFEKLSHVDE